MTRWPSYLLERTNALVKATTSASSEVPLGHHNPDNPNPNADFVPGPAGAPLPFAPLIRVAPPFMPLFPEFEQQAVANGNRPTPPPPRPPTVPRAQRVPRAEMTVSGRVAR